MSILPELENRFRTALTALDVDPEPLLGLIRRSQDPKFGDYQANFAMPLGKHLGKPPRDLAGEIVSNLSIEGFCESPEVAGPGFINLRVRDDWIIDRLTFAVEDGQRVVYFINWSNSGDFKSELWRFDFDRRAATSVNLSLYGFRIGDRELLDVARHGEDILISFDASGYTDHNLRVQRGIVQLKWKAPDSEAPRFVRHLPDAGTAPSRGLAGMEPIRRTWVGIPGSAVFP